MLRSTSASASSPQTAVFTAASGMRPPPAVYLTPVDSDLARATVVVATADRFDDVEKAPFDYRA